MELVPVRTKLREALKVEEVIPFVVDSIEVKSSSKPFIEANTIESTMEEIRQDHIIPVFVKDNEPTISQYEFVNIVQEVAREVYPNEDVLSPSIRLSHPIKGRVPGARHKPANELFEHEKTLYYERMAFAIEIPGIHADINNQRLNLTIGGIKAYNLDNLYQKRGADQHFKVFIGFKNLVCTNLCINTDGLLANLKVKSLEHLRTAVYSLLAEFNAVSFAQELATLQYCKLAENQFAQLIGKCKLFRHMPDSSRSSVAPIQFGDAQVNQVCKDYYSDHSFCRDEDGNINLWNLYNLFTGANKSSYIDSFPERTLNAYEFVKDIEMALKGGKTSWYLN